MSALRSLWTKTSVHGADHWRLTSKPGDPFAHPIVTIIDNRGSCHWSVWDQNGCVFMDAGSPFGLPKAALKIEEALERAEAKLLELLSAHEHIALISAAAELSDKAESAGIAVSKE